MTTRSGRKDRIGSQRIEEQVATKVTRQAQRRSRLTRRPHAAFRPAERRAGAVTAIGTARQWSTGKPLDLAAAVLTPGNADLLARRLATLRGPAMKVGQLLSLSGDEMVPEEFRNALAMLRSQGYSMPDTQLRRVLGREYGKGWQQKFARFDFEPVAAASIGQLHRARKHGGRELALKIQYPGVARSVDSDVENLAGLLRRLDFIPIQLDVRRSRPRRSASSSSRPTTRARRATSSAIAASWRNAGRDRAARGPHAHHAARAGDGLDRRRAARSAGQRGGAAGASQRRGRTLYDLMFRELFEFRFMQTDPNIANYLYVPATHQLVLLDLGPSASTRRRWSRGTARPAGPCCPATRRRYARPSSRSATRIRTIRRR